jgi:hypothetical protein
MRNTFGIEIMTSKLPINLENLLRQRQVEGERIEYKAGWNPDACFTGAKLADCGICRRSHQFQSPQFQES